MVNTVTRKIQPKACCLPKTCSHLGFTCVRTGICFRNIVFVSYTRRWRFKGLSWSQYCQQLGCMFQDFPWFSSVLQSLVIMTMLSHQSWQSLTRNLKPKHTYTSIHTIEIQEVNLTYCGILWPITTQARNLSTQKKSWPINASLTAIWIQSGKVAKSFAHQSNFSEFDYPSPEKQMNMEHVPIKNPLPLTAHGSSDCLGPKKHKTQWPSSVGRWQHCWNHWRPPWSQRRTPAMQLNHWTLGAKKRHLLECPTGKITEDP